MEISDRNRVRVCRIIEQAMDAVANCGDVFHVFGCDDTGPIGPAVLLVVRAEDVPAVIDALVQRHGDCEGAYVSHGPIQLPRA